MSVNGSVDLNNDETKGRSETVDLTDQSLLVDISDALSERDKVKFTVHTKTTLPDFAKPEFSVVRLHEEFIWLHDRIEENEKYEGFIIPPAPPRPDFDASREKLQRLGEGEGTMTEDEFKKMKAELEAEYLATFKKTVAMHEVFLCRLASHPVFKADPNFKVFLEYENDLSVRTKNKKERLETLIRSFSKSTDEKILATTQKDIDDFFERQNTFLLEYYAHVKDAASKSDRMALTHKLVADTFIKISGGFNQLATIDPTSLQSSFNITADHLEKARKIEGRVASDEDLKLVDLLRYYQRESSAAKDLLYRRLRCLANYESANKTLDKARARNREVHAAELSQHEACEKFEKISSKAQEELQEFKTRRVAAFKRHLIELAELEVKHAKAHIALLSATLVSIKEIS